MAQHPTEPERRSRKKSSHSSSKAHKPRSSSKKPHASQSMMNVCSQNYAPPVQVASTQYLHPYQAPSQNPTNPAPPQAIHSASAPQHPVYGRMPQQAPSYGHPYGSPPAQPVPPYTTQSAVRFASSPPAKPKDEGPFKEHWDKFDRMAAKSYADLRNGACKSATRLTTTYVEKPANAVVMKSMQALCGTAQLYDMISSKMDNVINSIDGECFSGKEQDLLVYENPQQTSPSHSPPPGEHKHQAHNAARQMVGSDKGSNHFSKVWLYSNSRLPPHLPPFKVYMPTYPLLCLAATYSEKVYTPPRSKSRETETHIPSDWRTGTKAMVLKSIPVDDMNTVVFAVRGSEGFMDWAVNYNTAPTTPEGFLEDASNLCHAGFLYVAKRMIKPVADRLRVLLEENPARSNCSLLITGHSAGGAVAALLYAHMMSKLQIESELSYLTGFFKRVHCITFGAPPITLRALQKPLDKRHRKSLFFAFVNEGDPVPRADKTVVKSLLKLYASAAPSASVVAQTVAGMSSLNLSSTSPPSPPKSSKLKSSFVPRLTRPSKTSLQTTTSMASSFAPEWPIPPCTLSPAGRLVVLRPRPDGRTGRKGEEIIEAITVDEETMRKVVYGDPLKHQMKMYRERIEGIATRAVTAGGF